MDNKKIAILIDAENISYKNAKQIIDIMSAKGDLLVKEIVTDWTKIVKAKTIETKYKQREKQIEGWRQEACNHSMTAIQQFSYISGKNTSDMALTIQAMKLLYEKPFLTTFCLVSNDSDFTRLAQELREHNKEVVGMGERIKAIPEFVNAFSEFIYLGEAIDDVAEVVETTEAVGETKAGKLDKSAKKIDKKLEKKQKKDVVVEKINQINVCPLDDERLQALKQLIDGIVDDNGVAHYSLISDNMKKQYADFVPTNYDCKNVSMLINKLMPYLPGYEQIRQEIPNNPNGAVLMLKRKG